MKHFRFCLISGLFCIGLLLPCPANAQRPDLSGMDNALDKIFDPNIRTARLYLQDFELSLPILRTDTKAKLLLSFDDLDQEVKYLHYTIVLCNADWEPVNLSEYDYIDGFTEDEIWDYRYSSGTLVPYTHYRLEFPNDNMSPKLPGNYLLVVYRDNDPDQLVLVKRFFYCKREVDMNVTVGSVMDTRKLFSHQRVSFTVDHENYPIVNPQIEISASIWQNQRFDNRLEDIQPRFIQEDKLIFDDPYKQNFAGGNEYRYFDTRSLTFRGERIRDLNTRKDGTDVWIITDRNRNTEPHLTNLDRNGGYVIANREGGMNPQVEADYTDVHFSLVSPYKYTDGEIYVHGQLTNWTPDPSNRMRWNGERGGYECSLRLKQGVYDYNYLFVPNTGDPAFRLGDIEGDRFETANQYLILLYHRSPSDWHDRLIGYEVINSGR